MKKNDNFIDNREKLISILQNVYDNPYSRLHISTETSPGSGRHPHTHHFHELFFLRDGKVYINLQGKAHNNITVEERKRLDMTIWITRTQIDWTIMHCGFQSYATEELMHKISALISYFQSLPELLASPDIPDINHDCARVLAGTLLRIFKQTIPPTYEKTSPIEKALLLIDKNYYDHTLTAQSIAVYCGYTLQGLNTVFRRIIGCSVRQCLIRRRLKVAAFELIKTADPDVRTIAFACGWTDRAYFSNKFRETYGFPPQTYRKMVLEGKIPPPPQPQPSIPFEGFFKC